MKDLQFGPDSRILVELNRLEELEKLTLAAWKHSN
jgi:hypothetical protein